MKTIERGPWIYYLSEEYKGLDSHKCGKWMYFFENKQFVSNICKKAIQNNIVVESKHSNAETGVSCFYINWDDICAHKKVLEFFLSKNLIKRTKAGKLYNISFKFDYQTRAGNYGDSFNPEIKLDQFIDLYTGEWII